MAERCAKTTIRQRKDQLFYNRLKLHHTMLTMEPNCIDDIAGIGAKPNPSCFEII